MTTQKYNSIVDLFSDKLYRFILKNIKSEEKAQDIVQDSFEKLWINKNSVDENKVKSYLFTIGYRTMIDVIRKDKKMSLNTDSLPEAESSRDEQYSDLQEILHNAIQKLPEVQRSVILLRDYEGYSYKEIAKILEITEAQVKVYIYRGRVFLKSYIKSPENVI